MSAADRLLPDQPPPQGGHGDVLADLAARVRREGSRRIVGGAFPLSDDRLRLSLQDALLIAGTLCHMLGVPLLDAIDERRRIGSQRYGQPLRYGDGRGLEDAAQEAIDLAAYLLREIGGDHDD